MAHKTADRVRETTTSTGTGDIVLAGAFSGYKAFSSVLTVGDTFYYAIAAYPGADWEVGLGTYSATNTITRTTVLASSNANAAVTFAAGTKEVFITAAADKLIQLDNLGNSNIGTATGVSFNSITGLSSVVGSTPGTAAIGTSTTVARADHVHPIQTTVSGNAGTATTWQTARTLTIGNTGKSVNGSANVTWSLAEIGAVASTEKGAVNGVATLDATGKVPSTQLPSYVDDVLEYANLAAFPATGETGKIYIALDTNKTYRWSGSAYVYITSGAVDSVNGQTGVVTISTISGNAGTATTWETARTLTVGLTGKSVNGSANVSWSLAEIGALPLTGGTLTGGLVGTSATFTGTVSWGNSVGQSNGNPRTLAIGYSGGNYGSAGYGISYTTTSDVHNYAIPDIASLWQAYDGIVVSAAPAGTVGTPVTWTTVLDARRSNASLLFKGSTVLDTSNYTTYVPTKTGTGATGTWNISVSGNSASSSALATWDGSTLWTPGSAMSSSGSRTTDLAPNTYSRGVFSEFKNSSLFGFTGNYTGLVTVAPWIGTAASTGDPNYQLSFNPSAANSTSNPSLKIRAGIDTTWGAWNTILHSGNYNSYSPTLTGTGASGTWGINITGSSASANSLNNFANNNNVSISTDSFTSNGISYTSGITGGSLFGQTDGAIFHQYYSGSWQAQIFQDYRSGQIALRGKNNGTWQGWRVVLDSGNYNSYAPTLTGTGASGTWGISVTGNAGTATTLQTARNINEVSFNGSANITIPRVKAINDENAAPADFTTAYATFGFGSWNNNNTAPYCDFIALRSYVDSSGGSDNMVTFRKDAIGMRVWQQTYGSATAFTTYKDVAFTDSSITGNAATATALQTARTISLTGGVTGSTSFNGTANVSITATVANDSHTHSNYMLRSQSVQANPNTNFASSAYRFDPNANNPTNDYYSILTYGNESNVVGQLATHFQTGQTFTRAYNTSWSAWRTLLDSTNYNSYSPTLSGTGASGTWGISVTGSAGSLSNNVDYMVNRGSIAQANQDNATSNGFYTRNNTGDSSGLLVFNPGGSVGPWQMHVTYTGLMEFRNKTDSTTWTPWKTVLTSANYNSYSPTLTGTGATGTWGISVTGNAGTATTLQTARTINGVSFNGSANITVTANTTNAVTFNNGGAGAASGSTFNGSGALTVSYNTVGAPSTTGTGASGTWGINISGNAATATSATDSTKLPLTGGTLSNPITFTSSAMIIGYSGAQTRGYVYSDSGGIGFLTNSGSWAARIDFGTANLNCFANISAAGNVYATGNVTAYSDERVKKNWRNVEEGFVDKLANVKSGIYDRTDAEMTQVGVSAQSLQEILPNAIEEKDDKLSVAYGNAALVSAIELAKEIVKLKQEIESLKEKLKEGT